MTLWSHHASQWCMMLWCYDRIMHHNDAWCQSCISSTRTRLEPPAPRLTVQAEIRVLCATKIAHPHDKSPTKQRWTCQSITKFVGLQKANRPGAWSSYAINYWNKKWKPNPAIDNNMQIEQIHMTPHAASVDPRSSNRKCQLALQQGYNCFMENKWPTSRLDRAAEIKMINLQE